MKKILILKDEIDYIFDNYNRYKKENDVDVTSGQACQDILRWLAGQEDFVNVVFDPLRKGE
jgi:hypothetical protein